MGAPFDMTIGQVARTCEMAPSAIRYYEKAGLLPKAYRVGNQRRYNREIVGRLRLLQFARDSGFTIAETRVLVAGFTSTTSPAPRWHSLVTRKLEEIDVQMAHLERMKTLLKAGFHCHCRTIDDCARIIGSAANPSRKPSAKPL
jgi:MerR family redox-sensitive transcriptional activator SoxR